MRRKAIIVLTITLMVTVMVTAFSYLYISQILRLRITNAYDSAYRLTQQLAYFAENDLPDLSSTRVDTNDPEAVRRALAEYLPMDTNLLNNLESETALWPYIYDASIVDANGKALLHSNPQLVGKQIPQRPDFHSVVTARFRDQLRVVYQTGRGLRRNLSAAAERRTVWHDPHRCFHGLSQERDSTPRLTHALYFSIASIFASLLLAAMISNVALGPLREISRNLDSVSSGHKRRAFGQGVGTR